MPNHIGAFLKASKCFSELGIHIPRVSYNKAVDSHTLFIEVDGLNGLRESNVLHKPYVNICKNLTDYKPIDKSKIHPQWKKSTMRFELEHVGYLSVGELFFDVYEGQGGHLAGEVVLSDVTEAIVKIKL